MNKNSSPDTTLTVNGTAQDVLRTSSLKRIPVTILMVDDQPSKLLTYEAILSELGEKLVKATTGREALHQLLAGDVALVLMDVSMPEIDGFELADMMRQHPRFQEIPIIFVSAVHLSEIDRIRGYKSGAVDYISVPVVPEVLRAKVSVFVDLHRKTRELQDLNRELEDRVAERSEALRGLNNQLQQRVAELESIMRVLPVGVAVAHDPECRNITGNAALSELAGMDPGENISKTSRSDLPYTILRNGELISIDELPVQLAVRTGKPTSLSEIEVRSANGNQTRTLLAAASPLFDEEGQVRGGVGAFFDVTERKHLEDALRERAELLELASEAIMVRDADGIIRSWNAGAEAMYGWSRDEAIGADCTVLLGTDSVAREQFTKTLMEQGRWEGDLYHRTKDGRELVVASRQARKWNSSLILEINRDITSQRLAEEALRRNERLVAMGKVAGIVAHEINNPLAAITNTFYLLRNHPSLDDEARYYADLAEQELARVSSIAKQTLSFYKESQVVIEAELGSMVDDVLDLQHGLLLLNCIELEKRYQEKYRMLRYPIEMKQVFMNLISNAIEAMPNGGRLRIRIGPAMGKHRSPGVQISISDTGSGVSSEHAKRLFEPFYTTKQAKGTGLGLWISRGIAQKYEGTVEFRTVYANGEARTCFRVTLP